MGQASSTDSLNHDQLLKEFQNSGDTTSLMNFVEASGRNTENFREAVKYLWPVLEAFVHGSYPNYDRLNPDSLQTRHSEVVEITLWLVESDKADIQSTALSLIQALGWESFQPFLLKSIKTDGYWEPRYTIAVLKKIDTEWANAALKIIADDVTLSNETRTAAAKVLNAND